MAPSLGTLYGIGVGPADPDLISVKGVKCLQSVPVVAFPAGLNNHPGVAERIIQPWLQADQQQLALSFPYVQDPEQLVAAWQTAADTLAPYLEQGQSVAFASEGDVSFYSTFTYLSQTLLSRYPHLPVVTIPGIASPMAAAAELGIPLTTQGDRLAIIPSLYHVHEIEAALTWADVIVLMKVSSVYGEVWQILQHHDLLSHSSIVVRASDQHQVIYRNLQTHPQLKLPYFSILIVKVPKRSQP